MDKSNKQTSQYPTGFIDKFVLLVEFPCFLTNSNSATCWKHYAMFLCGQQTHVLLKCLFLSHQLPRFVIQTNKHIDELPKSQTKSRSKISKDHIFQQKSQDFLHLPSICGILRDARPPGAQILCHPPSTSQALGGLPAVSCWKKSYGIIHRNILQCEAPQDISWFRFAPGTIVINTINHSYWSFLNQLSYPTGASHCIKHIGILMKEIHCTAQIDQHHFCNRCCPVDEVSL